MKVKTLLNKFILTPDQTMRVIDNKSCYRMDSDNAKDVVTDCGRCGVGSLYYSEITSCYVIELLGGDYNRIKREERP